MFSLCINNTYFSDMQCLNCSSICKACYLSPDLCISCNENSFLKNNTCLKCNSVLNGCASCSNSSYCLQCENNTYALINGSCLECSSVLTGCLSCSNSSKCLQCKPLRTLFEDKCIDCFVSGCATCLQDNVCF